MQRLADDFIPFFIKLLYFILINEQSYETYFAATKRRSQTAKMNSISKQVQPETICRSTATTIAFQYQLSNFKLTRDEGDGD